MAGKEGFGTDGGNLSRFWAWFLSFLVKESSLSNFPRALPSVRVPTPLLAVRGIPPDVFPSAGKVLVVIWECNPLLLRVLHSEVENVTLFQILLCHIDYSGPGEGQGDLYQHKLRVPAALMLCRKPLGLFSLAGNIQWS